MNDQMDIDSGIPGDAGHNRQRVTRTVSESDITGDTTGCSFMNSLFS